MSKCHFFLKDLAIYLFIICSGSKIVEGVPVRGNDMKKYVEVGKIIVNKEKELTKEDARTRVEILVSC